MISETPQVNQPAKEFSPSANIWLVVGFFIVSVFLWNTFLLYPVKMFVVGLHELSHGIAAVLAGGRIDSIQLDPRIGGYCVFRLPVDSGFFKQVFVAASGYLGSIVWGAVIFFAASRSKKDRWITFFIALMMLVISFYVIRTREMFGIMFCFSFTLFLFAAAKWFPPRFHDIFLKFLGFTSCLYVIIDIKEDLIDRSGIGSDADRIAQLMGIPKLSVIVGIAWIVLAVIILLITLKYSFRLPEKNEID